MKRVFFTALATLCAAGLPAAPAQLSLAGTWRFQLDRADEGVAGRWFEKRLPEQLQLPGSLQAQGFGDEVTTDTKWIGGIVDQSWFTDPKYAPYRQPGNVKIPFWLQPEKHYAGAAWYQREVEIPSDWRDKRIVLHLERAHFGTTVWLDDHLIGSTNSLSTPHEYDLGTAASPGKHTLTLRVDNRLLVDVGINSHSVSDHTQGNWNGVAGALSLSATDRVWVEDVQVFPAVAEKAARVRVILGKATPGAVEGRVTASIEAGSGPDPITVSPVTRSFSSDQSRITTELEVRLGNEAKRWDEFQPALYRLRVAARGDAPDGPFNSSNQVTFGLREAGSSGTQLTVNGRKIFLRGTLECAIFPLTGYPPTDVDSWKRIIRICQAHGLNHIRFHSWCPPEAAFIAADELGFYFHVECASWANQSTTLGDGKPVDQYVLEESERIVRAYGNHPSFLMMAYGNEPGGRKHAEWLAAFVSDWRKRDPRRLYTGGAGWPVFNENQYHVLPAPRIQGWGEGLNSRINARPPETMTDYRTFIARAGAPVVSHEIGQWCVYPNFDEIPKYRGWLKAKNFEIFRDSLRSAGMLAQARDFLLASGKLQTLCYKEDIESALRTPGMAGFQLLDLHDFPGQGTALVGVLDPFWDSKGYVTASEYSRFCNSTVPLARMPKRIFTQDEEPSIAFDIAHFGPVSLTNVWPVFKFVGDDGKEYLKGHFGIQDIEVGEQGNLAELRPAFRSLPVPARYKLVCGLARNPDGLGMICENDWDIWVYPPRAELQGPAGVMVVDDLNEQALASLNGGGRILLMVPPARVKNAAKGKVVSGFSSIFWNTAWTGRQPPTTLGIFCDPKHPALAGFPTDYHSNWQWWELVSRSHPFILNVTPESFRPIVQVIDDWVTNRKLGLVWEAQVGGGKLLACSIDLTSDLDKRPVARQLRRSLLDYVASERFAPALRVETAFVRGLLQPPSATRE